MDKQILLEALITEREGMLAENTHRLDCGHSIAYGDEAFNKLANKMKNLASQPNTSADGNTEMRDQAVQELAEFGM